MVKHYSPDCSGIRCKSQAWKVKMTNIILFWSKPIDGDESFEEWRSRSIQLSVFHELTLTSQIKIGHNVLLYTYQNFDDNAFDIPEGVQIVDADQHYSAENAYTSLSNGHSIAHISDLVRIRGAIECNGVVVDMDAVAVNPLSDIEAFTSTHAAKTKGGMVIKFGKTQPRFITDGSWNGEALSVFPVKIGDINKRDMINLSDMIENVLKETPDNLKGGWNFIMYELREIANKYPEVYVMQPNECCPVPGWKSKGNCYSLEYPTKFDGESDVYGYKMPSIDDIFSNTYFVQHFFESAFKDSDGLGEDFWNGVKFGSLLDEECKFVFGENWRAKYTEQITLNNFWT